MNYKIEEYQQEFGANPLTDKMRKELAGLSVDEQIDYFVLEEGSHTEKSSYGEVDHDYSHSGVITLRSKMQPRGMFGPLCDGVIVSEGIIVGWIFNRWERGMLNQCRCTYFCCDDDGTGSTDVSVYHTLRYAGKKI